MAGGCERQQADDDLTCVAIGKLRAQTLPRLPINRPREDIVAENPSRKGARLAFEVCDHVPVIDPPRVSLAAAANGSRAFENTLTAKVAFHALGVHAYGQAIADQLAGRAVLFALHHEDAVFAHACR